MALAKFDGLELPATADYHVHLRDGAMMRLVTPTIRQGGVNTVMVMPNLVPPITTVSHALSYKSKLEALAPNVRFLMSLYLHESITPEIIIEARKAGILNVKSYPAGVTTNSSSGVVSYEPFYPLFEEMQRQGMILNLHGERPSGKGVTVMSAEADFLPTLMDLHQQFPKLRIVLEHCTTAAAIETVKRCGPTVAGTITAHHLSIIIDDVCGDSFNFCKPVAKLTTDRSALLKAAVSGNPKFFLGTDSAPHPITAKLGTQHQKASAGLFTQPYATQLVLDAFERGCDSGDISADAITADILEGFLSKFGTDFYAIEPSKERIRLKRDGESVVEILSSKEGDDGVEVEVVPFRKGERMWGIEWM